MKEPKASQGFKSITALAYEFRLKAEAVQELTLKEMYEHLLDIIDGYETQIRTNRSERNTNERHRTDGRYHVPKYYGKHILSKIWEVETDYGRNGNNGEEVSGRIVRNASIFADNQDAFTWKYESPIYTHIDVDDFINIIQNGVAEEHSCFGEQEPMPFWNEFKQWASENYSIIFNKYCLQLGLPLTNQKHGLTKGSTINKRGTIVNTPYQSSPSTNVKVTIKNPNLVSQL